MHSVDPLTILKEYIMENKDIKLVDNKKLCFGKIHLDLLTKTSWVKNIKNGDVQLQRYT